MKADLIQINPKDYGLTDVTAKQIREQFEPMLKCMEGLENEYNQVVSLPIEDIETAKKAKELRLKYVKVRTGTAEIHKEQKAFYLNGGRFVDGWKNAQIFASEGKEKALQEIENYKENLEKQRIEKLHSERLELITPYINAEDVYFYGSMQADVWEAYYNTKVKNHNDKIEAEKKAEQERIEKEKREAEERENQRLENERMKKEIDAKNKLIAEEKSRAEQEKKKLELKIKKETEAKNKLIAEEKARAEQEKAKLKKIEDEKKKLQKLSIEKQLTAWINSFELPKTDIKNGYVVEIESKFKGFKEWCLIEVKK